MAVTAGESENQVIANLRANQISAFAKLYCPRDPAVRTLMAENSEVYSSLARNSGRNGVIFKGSSDRGKS